MTTNHSDPAAALPEPCTPFDPAAALTAWMVATSDGERDALSSRYNSHRSHRGEPATVKAPDGATLKVERMHRHTLTVTLTSAYV